LRLDFCSNVTGVDWLDRTVKKTVKVKKVVDGEEKEVAETTEEKIPGYLEAVYHLYSMTHKHGPVIIRMRTADRGENVCLASLTTVWRSAEFQEREIFDLYGIHFDGHLDLRPVVEKLAAEFGFGTATLSFYAKERPWWVSPSDWMLLTRDAAFLEQEAIRAAKSPRLEDLSRAPL